jgi:hypothetical protein
MLFEIMVVDDVNFQAILSTCRNRNQEEAQGSKGSQ